jgi:menaquinone-dependent protoporphyrinogen IX oxidase
MNADRVFVACAGSPAPTREEMEEIGRSLTGRGFRVAIREATVEEIDAYSGVVLGGALDAGRPRSRAVRFLKRSWRRLAGRPFAVLAIGPRPLEEDWSVNRAWADEVAGLSVPLSTAREGFR